MQARYRRIVDLIKDGRVFIPEKSEWVEKFLHEIVSFPSSDNDDQVDALSQALIWLRVNPVIPEPPERCPGVVVNMRSPPQRPSGPPYIFCRKR